MRLRLLGLFWLVALPFGIFGQNRVGEWHHLTSALSIRQLVVDGEDVYCATTGGVLIYNYRTQTYQRFGMNEGLIYPDIKSIAIIGDWLWLGGALPKGIIQLVYLPSGQVSIISLDVDQITHVSAWGNRGFAAFRDGQDAGIIELRGEGESFGYADIYRSFLKSNSTILDLDIWQDTLYVTTSAGIIAADYARDNLKDPLDWREVASTELGETIQFHVDAEGKYVLALDADLPPRNHPDVLYRKEADGWHPGWFFNGSTVRRLSRSSTGEFSVSVSNSVVRLLPGGYVRGTSRAPKPVLDYWPVPEIEGGFASVDHKGLYFYSTATDEWTPLTVNATAGQGYSAVLKLSTGELVASGERGIARYDGSGWYNLIPGHSLLDEGVRGTNNGNSQVLFYNTFLADTLDFDGGQSWNLLELSNGDILVGLRKNWPTGGGILRFSYNDLDAYQKYDTSNGHLSGKAKDSYLTIRHMNTDSNGNVWIAMSEAASDGNSIAVLRPDHTWVHFSIDESGGKLNQVPTEIAFDDWGRVYIACHENTYPNAPGGITVLDHNGTLGNKEDDSWYWMAVQIESDHSNSVWSMAFDKHGMLWTLTPQGLMGWQITDTPTLVPVTNFGYYLSDIPFVLGSRMRIDAENNKWISSPGHGIWVLLDNTTFWPDINGINADNSELPTNEITDIYLDDREGLAYIATTKGIHSLKIPFREAIETYSELAAFPSPFRTPATKPLTITGLRQGSTVKVFTVTGLLVRELSAQGGDVAGYQAFWDGRNSAGGLVGSGVYLISGYLPDGKSGVTKLGVIRQP